ncbi:hypothetical protein CKO28_01130 [Rhodovibrio sodomensis]|uniref:histidine kinase n=1 Tax=Rhodovibrio sodomensis TaxID=1088 RepID=A0ABS1D8B3_9PROT|nr:PAS domain-containing sensor histidine kinase [Rhodovibrio sodomensis]MBK1666646.1 hypothetical protein [Rhodovibrio sodomensis]
MQGYSDNLRSIDATYRAFFERNKAAAVLLDPATLAIKDMNEAACRLYGIGRDEAVDVSFMRFVTQAEEIVRKHIRQALNGEHDSDYRHKQPHIDHNGTPFQAQLHMGPIEIAGRTHVYAIIIDITEEEDTIRSAEHSLMSALHERDESKKELQAALAREQQAAAQERATSKAQREFLRMLSHELNTPLAVINSLARALTRKSALDPEVMRTKAGEIMLAVSQASDLVRTHLNTAQYDYDTLGLSSSVHEPGQLAEEVARSFIDANPHHTFLFDIHDTEIQILLDPGRVTQILNNLISNAVKYSPEGGQIRISSWADSTNGRYVIEIADQGIGVAPDELERLFEKYYRATNTGSISGSGYGLYMCRRFARLHHGDVTAFSEGRNGTVMTFWLPLKQPGELSEEQRETAAAETSSEPERMRRTPLSRLKANDSR